MPKVSETYLEAKRRQVLDAAYTCFAENGFHATTMQDIAREAGVSYGVVYHYFDSKDDVIEGTWHASRKAREARLEKALESPAVPDVLAEFLNLSVGRLDQPDSIPEMRLRIQLFGAALLNPRIGENLRGVWDEVVETLEEIIQRGQERGEIDGAVDARALARTYIAVHDGFLLQKTIDPDVDIGEMIDVFWAMHRGALWSDRAKGNGGDGSGDGRHVRS